MTTIQAIKKWWLSVRRYFNPLHKRVFFNIKLRGSIWQFFPELHIIVPAKFDGLKLKPCALHERCYLLRSPSIMKWFYVPYASDQSYSFDPVDQEGLTDCYERYQKDATAKQILS